MSDSEIGRQEPVLSDSEIGRKKKARIGFADRAVDVCIAVGDKTSFGRMERERNGANALGKPCVAGLFFGGLLADGGAAR